MVVGELAAGAAAAKGTITAIQSGLDLVKRLRGKSQESGEAASEELEGLEKLLYEMMGNVARLQAEQIELTETLSHLRKAADLKANYRLAEVDQKTYAYIPINDRLGSEGRIICPVCFEDDRLSVLTPKNFYGTVTAVCPKCNLEISAETHWSDYVAKVRKEADNANAAAVEVWRSDS